MKTLARYIEEAKYYAPAVGLDRRMRRTTRRIVRVLMLLVSLSLLVVYVSNPEAARTAAGQSMLALGTTLFAGALYMMMQQCQYRSLVVRMPREQGAATFDDAKYLLNTKARSVGEAFVVSGFGKEVLRRIGVVRGDAEALRESVAVERVQTIECVSDDCALNVMNAYASIQAAVAAAGATPQDIYNAISWVRRRRASVRLQGFWWRYDRLHRIPSVGHRWLYGATFTLLRYGTPARSVSAYEQAAAHRGAIMHDIQAVEAALHESTGSNAVLIGKSHEIALEAALGFASLVYDGAARGALARVFPLYIESAAFSDCTTAADFDQRIISMFNEASAAGGMMILIGHADALFEQAHALGSQLVPLLETVLSAGRIPLVLITDEQGYHGTIEPHHSLATHTHKVICAERDDDAARAVLEDAVVGIEAVTSATFTVGALRTIIHAARDASDTVRASLAILSDITPRAVIKAGNYGTVTATLVTALLPNSSNVAPRDAFIEEHKASVLALREKLPLRVLGQSEALRVVVETLEASFAGLRDDTKPMAAFLAFGPSGVGKTETAKALAEFLFGSRDALIRFDMSEFSSSDGVEKMIGSPYGEAGALSEALSVARVGVILLDELEKANPKVIATFLQVLDEGSFTDGRGDSISVRNFIIFATSNAASDLLFSQTQGSADPATARRTLIDAIVARGIFTPEFLNRFDALLPYQPLNRESFRDIVVLAIKKSIARIRERGVIVQFGPQAVDAIASRLYDERFGAREIDRSVTAMVEEPIARAMLSNSIVAGATVELVPESSAYNARLIVRPVTTAI